MFPTIFALANDAILYFIYYLKIGEMCKKLNITFNSYTKNIFRKYISQAICSMVKSSDSTCQTAYLTLKSLYMRKDIYVLENLSEYSVQMLCHCRSHFCI